MSSRHISVGTLVALIMFATACGGDNDPNDASGDGDGESGTGDGVPVGQIAAAFGVPNVDDDDENGKPDFSDPGSAADDDLAPYLLPKWLLDDVVDGDVIELSVEDPEVVRFWRRGQVILGDGVAIARIPAAEATDTLFVEFGDFLAETILTMRQLGEDGDEVITASNVAIAAPLIVNHHLQPAERVWAVPAGGNASMIDEFARVLGDRFIEIDSEDVWIQDELEWATVTAPGGVRLNVAMDSIRDRALDRFVKGLRAPDYEPMTWGKPSEETTEDKFGNFEVTPPHSAAGVEYPFGRIYYGDNGVYGPNETIKTFLAAQQIQAPIELDTSWLCVGHVDEFVSFVPFPDAPRGFRLLVSDVLEAYRLLEGLDRATTLPRYDDSHGYATVGELVDDAALHALNDELQTDYIEPTIALMRRELELTDDEIVRLPGLFETLSCPYKSGRAVSALIPGMLNLVVAQSESLGNHVFVSDPFLRSDPNDPGADPLMSLFAQRMPAGVDVHFVDDWYTYHVNIGEVHCGTNVERTPVGDWWRVGGHLLGL